jgi:hypothetical protein
VGGLAQVDSLVAGGAEGYEVVCYVVAAIIPVD